MVTVVYELRFKRIISKIHDQDLNNRVKQQINRIVEDPTVGKPMRFFRKNTREVYIPPFRLSYCWQEEQNTLIFLDLSHKDEQ
ncbi:MAG: type II toxin-antitoxin system RelE/ParE family toxin [Methanobacteriota archaeon]